MSIQIDLSLFGLNDQEQHIYVLLSRRSWSTVVELSKHCPIKRTTLYRILESLIQKGLVATQVSEKTTFYNITSADGFESIVIESETKTKQMKSAIENIKKYTEVLSNVGLTDTSVLYYKGIRGLKQMDWKITEKQNIEIQSFDSNQWVDVVGSEFAQVMRQEAVKKNIRYRTILNHEDPISPSGITTWTENTAYIKKHYRHRIISGKIMDIKQDIIISPDSIVLWGIKTGDEVAIQITNSEYAQMMRQIFEFMWDKAKVIDNFGGRFK